MSLSPGAVPQNVLLISEQKLKTFTDIDLNVNTAVLLPFIQVAQQTVIEYVLGAKYYKELLYQVSGGTLTQTNENFLNYFVQPCLIWAAYREALPSVWGRIKNNGIVNGSEQTITLKEMQWFMDKANERAQFFQQRMIQELIFNSNLYPLVFTTTSNQGLFPHLGVNYNCSVHIPNGYGDTSPYGIWKRYGLMSYKDPTLPGGAGCCGY